MPDEAIELSLIDTDAHIYETPDVFTSRLPKKWGDHVMHIRWDDELKAEVWCLGDQVLSYAWNRPELAETIIEREGTDVSKHGALNSLFVAPTQADADPAAYDAGERVKFMDSVGIRSQVLYPNSTGIGFGGDVVIDLADPVVGAAHCRAYNDYMYEEFVAPYPERFVPVVALPYWDIPRAVEEVQRCAEFGFRSATLTGVPERHGLPMWGSLHWDPLLEAMSDAEMSVSFHAAVGIDQEEQSRTAKEVADLFGPMTGIARRATDIFLQNAIVCSNLLFSGVLARFPETNWIIVETGVGWVPYVLELADYRFKRHRIDKQRPEFGDLLPSDLFHRQIYVNYLWERVEPIHVQWAGENNILFETDFPHEQREVVTSGNVRRASTEYLSHLPESVQRKIRYENAARLFKLNMEKPVIAG